MRLLLGKLNTLFWSENSNLYARRLWLLFFAIVALLAFFQPTQRNITCHYSRAAYHWWNSENMYSLTGNGFLYFPQSAMLYTPFAWQEFPKNISSFKKQPLSETLLPTLPLRIAEVLYRAFSLGLLCWAVWRMCELFKIDSRYSSLFSLVTVLTIPASLTAGRNGQFNLLLAATMILATVAVTQKRWGSAATWLVLGVLVKPLGLVPLLLFGVLYPALWWRLAVGMLCFMGMSFIHYDPKYVLSQWQMCIEQMRTASTPTSNSFDDIAGMFRTFGINGSDQTWFAVRASFAFLTLGIAWRLKKIYSPEVGPLLIAGLSAAYLMAFNPRTETVSYVIIAPFVAMCAGLLIRQQKSLTVLTALLVFLCIGFGADCYGDIYKLTRIWFKPLLALLFFGLLMVWGARKYAPIDHRNVQAL